MLFWWIMWITLCITQIQLDFPTFLRMWKTFAPFFALSTFFPIIRHRFVQFAICSILFDFFCKTRELQFCKSPKTIALYLPHYPNYLSRRYLLCRSHRVRPIRDCSYDLTKIFGTDIACCKDSRLTGNPVLSCHNISCFIQLHQHSLNFSVPGTIPDWLINTPSVSMKLSSCVFLFWIFSASTLSVPSIDNGMLSQTSSTFLHAKRHSWRIFSARSSSLLCTQINLCTGTQYAQREKDCILHRHVSATDHDNRPVLKKCCITRSAQ